MVDINGKDADGRTALMRAAIGNHKDVVRTQMYLSFLPSVGLGFVFDRLFSLQIFSFLQINLDRFFLKFLQLK